MAKVSKRKIVKGMAFSLCILIVLGCFMVLLFVNRMTHSESYVGFDRSRLNEVCSDIKLLDVNGNEIKETLSLNNNKQIPLSALHEYTYMAFVAVEDKRFFQHNGIDGKRVLGAIVHNLESKGFKEGASTISQQLIKNTHLSNDKTFERKVNEMLLALELEKNYTKTEILEMYLNTIYFGRNAYGIENAANVYFNKSAAELTVSESAVLAGMIKAPNTYAPDKNEEKCKNRRNTVLKLMLEQGIISQAQFDEAIGSEIVYTPHIKGNYLNYTSQVIDEACRLLNMSQAQLYKSGFVIETYYDPTIQQILTNAAGCDNTLTQDGKLADLSCLICNSNGGIAACYFRGTSGLSKKQIGSTAKPIAVYTPALCEKIITQASPVLDEPTDFSGYKPANANGYNGWTTIKNAVCKSLNVPAVKTLNSLGLNNAQKYLKKLGFEGEQNLSLALGNVEGGMTACELLNCYATLADGGINNGAAYIKSIYCDKGEIYCRHAKSARVFDTNSAYLMTDMLRYAVENGTAKALKKVDAPIAAKTGTVGNANGNNEAIVCGYTTEHTFVFWHSGNLPNKVNGGTAPCELAVAVLKKMYETKTPKEFEKPHGVTQLTLDKDSLYNKQLMKLAKTGEKFMFDNGNKPTATVKEKTYDYKLTATYGKNGATLRLPKVENGLFWKIFKDGAPYELEAIVSNGTYYAELWDEKACVYTTPKLEIANKKTENEFPDFFQKLWLFP